MEVKKPMTIQMASRRRNRLALWRDIQEITRRHQRNGASATWVYYNHIADTYFISLSSYQRIVRKNLDQLAKEIGE